MSVEIAKNTAEAVTTGVEVITEVIRENPMAAVALGAMALAAGCVYAMWNLAAKTVETNSQKA